MEIFDFRIRPPYKSFTRLGIFNPPCNELIPQRYHAIPSQSAREKSMALFWREMAEAGIKKGVAMGRQVPDDMASVSNADIHSLARAYPDRIIPFGSLDITHGVAATMAELENLISQGFAGVAMEPAYALPPRFADANVLYPVYARLEEAKLPVVLTMSFIQGNLDYSNPVTVQHVAEDFPELQIVVAHSCYPWILHVINACVKSENIWLLPDIYMYNPDSPGNQMYKDAFNWLDGERILFGSAYPCYNMKQAVDDMERFGLSDSIKEKFYYGNAKKLLGALAD